MPRTLEAGSRRALQLVDRGDASSAGIDTVAIQRERPDLEGRDDAFVLRAAASERRVLVTNNVRDFAPLVEAFGLSGETHYGVIFTDDARFPRTHAGVGLITHALAKYVEGTQDDDLLNSCVFLPPPGVD